MGAANVQMTPWVVDLSDRSVRQAELLQSEVGRAVTRRFGRIRGSLRE